MNKKKPNTNPCSELRETVILVILNIVNNLRISNSHLNSVGYI